MAAGSIVEVIGRTPAVWLDRMVAARGLEGRILAKLDYLNPGFSKKDRVALGIIEAAEAAGVLAQGQVVVELTSGNMGTGLAIVCAAKGYPFVAVMSRGNSPERARMMAALGAEVVLMDQAPGSVVGEVSGEDLALVEEEARRITEERGAFRADQFRHPGNAAAHFQTTGPELWADSDGTLTAFADFTGSGGTFAGTLKALKARNPDLRGYVVEPEGAAVLAGEAAVRPGHPIQGGGYAMADLAQMEGVQADGFVQVSGDEARETARALAREEGIFAGFSSGANVAAALRLLEGPERGGVVAVVICDSGLKYLSTDLWA
ncbi:PLP-dependent cysteine synthase family protein [Jhaorihella thermophila]|uniref:Cysteine synthase A n=1 Tax=Jhaorihella thermophila TaxID=488547 RepID=A0A1H5VJU1_9RHOB|nr:cysteine synthase family protein [Jhaorihella thermophila]SEF87098.1 cysteine synthase A [Jhaorihella thermophila]